MRSPRARLHLLASRAHKWLAIVVGAQLLLWFASGALMSFLPIDRVHGDHLVDRTTVMPLNPGVELAASSEYLRSVGAPVQSITIRMLGSKPVAEVMTAKGVTLVDAVTASSSGLDPHISPEYAAIQINRIADARGIPAEQLRELVAAHTQGPDAGYLGESRVNVLELNIAVDELEG